MVRRSAVFDKVQRAPWPNDASKFSQRRRSIRDRAQREGKESSITARIVKGQALAIQADIFDFDRRGRHPIGREFLSNNGRINGIHLGDVAGHMDNVQPTAEPRLNNDARDALQALLTPHSNLVAAERQVYEPRENLISPKGHIVSMAELNRMEHPLTKRGFGVRIPESALQIFGGGQPSEATVLIDQGCCAVMFTECLRVGAKYGNRPQAIVKRRAGHKRSLGGEGTR